MSENENLQLAKITNQQQWDAYRKLFEQENRKRGINAKPLPETRPQPTASQELDIVIQRAFDLWEKQAPLKGIKDFFRHTKDMVSEETEYHYQQARTYLENTLSGAVSIVEDSLGLSSTIQDNRTNYFIDPQDFLTAEEQQELPTTDKTVDKSCSKKEHETKANRAKDSPIVNRILAKGSEDITALENAVCNFFNQFKAR